MVGGEVSGSQHHQPPGSPRSGVPLLVGSRPSTSPPGSGFSICRKAQRYCSVCPLRRNQYPAPRLHYCFLTAPPLLLHPLPSLICNCLNLPFGAQGRSRRQKSLFLQTKNREHRRVFVAWRAPQSPAWFHFSLWVCKSHAGELSGLCNDASLH